MSSLLMVILLCVSFLLWSSDSEDYLLDSEGTDPAAQDFAHHLDSQE